MTRFEIMGEEEAQRIVDYTRRSIAANLLGGIHSADPRVRAEARLMSLQAETYEDRAAAKRRLRSVTDDMGAVEYREYVRDKRALFTAAVEAARAKR